MVSWVHGLGVDQREVLDVAAADMDPGCPP